MIPGKHDIELYRGDTFRRFPTLSALIDGVPGDPIDLTGCTVLAQLRESPQATEPLHSFDAEILDQIDLETRGKIRIELTPAQTTDLPETTFWDLQLTHPNGDVFTYLVGTVTAEGQVSR